MHGRIQRRAFCTLVLSFIFELARSHVLSWKSPYHLHASNTRYVWCSILSSPLYVLLLVCTMGIECNSGGLFFYNVPCRGYFRSGEYSCPPTIFLEIAFPKYLNKVVDVMNSTLFYCYSTDKDFTRTVHQHTMQYISNKLR